MRRLSGRLFYTQNKQTGTVKSLIKTKGAPAVADTPDVSFRAIILYKQFR